MLDEHFITLDFHFISESCRASDLVLHVYTYIGQSDRILETIPAGEARL